jgi:hypothetical protein
MSSDAESMARHLGSGLDPSVPYNREGEDIAFFQWDMVVEFDK